VNGTTVHGACFEVGWFGCRGGGVHLYPSIHTYTNTHTRI
jgi:hypothetical protein